MNQQKWLNLDWGKAGVSSRQIPERYKTMEKRQEAIQNSIREKARELLSSKRVDLVIGFGEGTLPLRATPIFIRTPKKRTA